MTVGSTAHTGLTGVWWHEKHPETHDGGGGRAFGDVRVRRGLAMDVWTEEGQHVRPEGLVAHLAGAGAEGALEHARGRRLRRSGRQRGQGLFARPRRAG